MGQVLHIVYHIIDKRVPRFFYKKLHVFTETGTSFLLCRMVIQLQIVIVLLLFSLNFEKASVFCIFFVICLSTIPITFTRNSLPGTEKNTKITLSVLKLYFLIRNNFNLEKENLICPTFPHGLVAFNIQMAIQAQGLVVVDKYHHSLLLKPLYFLHSLQRI